MDFEMEIEACKRREGGSTIRIILNLMPSRLGSLGHTQYLDEDINNQITQFLKNLRRQAMN
jgi:hypothetical protein